LNLYIDNYKMDQKKETPSKQVIDITKSILHLLDTTIKNIYTQVNYYLHHPVWVFEMGEILTTTKVNPDPVIITRINLFRNEYTKLFNKIIKIFNSNISYKNKKAKLKNVVKYKARKKASRELIAILKHTRCSKNILVQISDIENKLEEFIITPHIGKSTKNKTPKKLNTSFILKKIRKGIEIDNKLTNNIKETQIESLKITKLQNRLKGIKITQDNLKTYIELSEGDVAKKFIVRNDKYNTKIKQLDEKIQIINTNKTLANKRYRRANKSRKNTKKYILELYIPHPYISGIILSYNTT